MNLATRSDLQQTVLERLFEHRRSRERLAARGLGPSEQAELALWVSIIDRVHAAYQSTNPEKARAMERLFGFAHPVPRRRTHRSRIIKLSMEFCVSEPTMYKWREEIVFSTMLAAVEAGALRPYGLANISDEAALSQSQ